MFFKIAMNLQPMQPRHLFTPETAVTQGERFETWLTCRNVVIERIVSSDAVEPTLYHQVQDEWIVLLQGHATLEVAGKTLALTAGDTLFIPAQTPHQVLSTSQTPHCIWLAVHIYGD